MLVKYNVTFEVEFEKINDRLKEFFDTFGEYSNRTKAEIRPYTIREVDNILLYEMDIFIIVASDSDYLSKIKDKFQAFIKKFEKEITYASRGIREEDIEVYVY